MTIRRKRKKTQKKNDAKRKKEEWCLFTKVGLRKGSWDRHPECRSKMTVYRLAYSIPKNQNSFPHCSPASSTSTYIHIIIYILNTSWTIEFQTELPIILMIKTKSYCFIVMSKLGWLASSSSSHWQDNGMDYWQWWKWIFPLHNEIWRKSMREREGNSAAVCMCHSSWITGLRSMRCSIETLQNLLYFM